MKETAYVKNNKKEVVRYEVYDEYCGFKPCYFVYARVKEDVVFLCQKKVLKAFIHLL